MWHAYMTWKPPNSFSYFTKKKKKSLYDETTPLLYIYFRGSALNNILWYFIPARSPDSFHFLLAPKGLDHVAPVGERRCAPPLQQPEHKLSMWVRSAQIHIVSYSKTNGRLTQKGIRRIPQGLKPLHKGTGRSRRGFQLKLPGGSLQHILLCATYGLPTAKGALQSEMCSASQSTNVDRKLQTHQRSAGWQVPFITLNMFSDLF